VKIVTSSTSRRVSAARAGSVVALLVWLAGTGLAARQPPMAEHVYLNVQVLKGIPVDRFNDTMGMFSAALLLDCVGCHAPQITSDPKAFAVATPRIQRARQMVLMMNAINKSYFAGQPRVTCFTCHAGDPQPERSPSLKLQYGELVEDPSSLKFFPSVNAPPAAQTLGRYVAAFGGADRLATVRSVAATGTYEGFDTSTQKVPLEIVARAPDLRAMVARAPGADLVWTSDGQRAWRYQPDTPVPLIELTGWNVAGARLDAMVFFPAGFVRASTEWLASFAEVDGRRVDVVRGTMMGQAPVNLYFETSGLLIRVVRWAETAAGPVPVQTDYADYREVAGGVRMPFRWVTTWTNGQSTIQLENVRVNVPVDAARFARPAAAPATR
jgi:outer membrane lipoprotein-sorting protein